MVKSKKNRFQKLISGNKLSAIAVVVLCSSLGTLALPRIFAERPILYGANSVAATATNDATYTINLTWKGTTPDHWAGKTFKDGTLINQWNSNSLSKNFKNLSCTSRYRYAVAPVNANGVKQADYVSSDSLSPGCPNASLNGFSAAGNTLNLAWSTNFGTSFTVYVGTNGGAATSRGSTSSTSLAIGGSCGTSYTAYVVATAGGQAGSASNTRSVSTAACPSSGGSGGSSGGSSSSSGGGGTAGGSSSSSGGSSSSSSGGSGGSSSSGGSSNAASSAPATPANFSATVVSSKIVDLNWDSAANAESYTLSRSEDNSNWTELGSTKLLSYSDESAAFNKTYYYQLVSISSDGQKSEAATAQATTEAFVASSSNKVTSDDKLLTIQIPDGAIDGNFDCAISSSQEGIANQPVDLYLIAGPYELLCVTEAGDTVNSFKKPVKVTLDLSEVGAGFDEFSAQNYVDSKWQAVEGAEYDPATGKLTFNTDKTAVLAAYGQKSSNLLSTIFTWFFILLILGLVVGGLLWWWRRRSAQQTPSSSYAYDMSGLPAYGPTPGSTEHIDAASAATAVAAGAALTPQQELTAEEEFKQALAAPNCTHIGMAQQVVPSSSGCMECEQQHTHWNSLRICLICGHVGCSDDSPEQHALKHFQETGHPIIYDFANPNGNNIGWCYTDQTYI